MRGRLLIIVLVLLLSFNVYFGNSAAFDFSNLIGGPDDAGNDDSATDTLTADITGVESATIVELRYSDGTTSSVRLAGVDPPHDRDRCQQLKVLGARQYLRGLIGETVVVETVSRDRPVGREDHREVRLQLEKSKGSDGKTVNEVVQNGIASRARAANGTVSTFGSNVSLPVHPPAQNVENHSERALESDLPSFEEACSDERHDFEPEIPSANGWGLEIFMVKPDDNKVVLRNTRDRRIDYSRWRVENERGKGYFLPKGYNLGPEKMVGVHTGAGENGMINLYANKSEPLWSDAGNAVLRNAEGEIVDTYEYE